MSQPAPAEKAPVPELGTIKQSLRFDLQAGLLVFLIALPLCLGISVASGFPAINGVFTAIIGGIVCGLISNSELTIKGPAAGMIAIVLGCVTDFAMDANITKDTMSNTNAAVYMEYLPHVVAVAVVAGVVQILLGYFKAGGLADFFPSAVIHGLLASIGLIIIGKQLYMLLGLKPNGSTEAYEAYLELPAHLPHYAWQAAAIGIPSLLFLFLYPVLKGTFKICKIIPPQLIILVVAIPAAAYLYAEFDGFKRSYEITEHGGHVATQEVKSLLVKVPDSPAKLPGSFIFPSFAKIGEPIFWKWVLMFTLVGTLESLLSAKAVDVLDPWQRKSDLNRDLLAVGIANSAVALIGGLPMISEIVRSSANKDYGARTHFSNLFHGLFLLASILILPFLLNKIPLTALAAMLIFAGCRLAHYKEFLHMLHIGKEQLFIFVATIIGVLATDLLIGVAIGIFVKFIVEAIYGVKPAEFFRNPAVAIPVSDEEVRVQLLGSAVFSNWLRIKRLFDSLADYQLITIDCTDCTLIDHTVMTHLMDLKKTRQQQGLKLEFQGLDEMAASSKHPLSIHKQFPSNTLAV